MNKQELYQFLGQQNIKYFVIEHQPVYTIADAAQLLLPHPEAAAKNLFLRDDKKQNYYLLTVRDALTIDLKHVQQQIGSRRLSFASEEDLAHILNLKKGAVTPFGVLNDNTCTVQVYIDVYFKYKMIAVHPNENDATVFLQTEELMELLSTHGNRVSYITLA